MPRIGRRRDAQRRLQRTRFAYEALCRTLPWSVEPMPGWEGEKQLHSDSGQVGGMPDSPGYSSEQSAEEAHLRGLLLDLSTTVSTHPFWQTLQGPDLVAARMELKQTTLAPATEAH